MNRPCRDCGRPNPRAQCAACARDADARRGRRQSRGYGADYDRARRAMVARAWQAGDPCVICGLPFERMADITAEHLVPVRAGGSGDLANLAPAHGWCNSAWRRRETSNRH